MNIALEAILAKLPIGEIKGQSKSIFGQLGSVTGQAFGESDRRYGFRDTWVGKRR